MQIGLLYCNHFTSSASYHHYLDEEMANEMSDDGIMPEDGANGLPNSRDEMQCRLLCFTLQIIFNQMEH